MSNPAAKSISYEQLSTPKGGGSIKNIGENFSPNAFSGTGSYSIPIPVSPARGYEPHLSIDYSSGTGNGEFGIGFSLSLSKISIRTELGIPRYNGKDVYIAGGGELVPKKRKAYKDENNWDVYEYLPRVEASFSLIKHHVKQDKLQSYWEIISAENETSFYGLTDASRVYNPDDTSQIFEWLIDKSTDARGNQVVYRYLSENDEGATDKIWEKGRSYNNKYIHNIKYGNYLDPNGDEKFAFEQVFDYGEYDISDLDQSGKNPYLPVNTWGYRPDAFSTYKSGFEIRTCRLCCGVLLFHHFENELGDPCLVKSISLTYKDDFKYGSSRVSGLSIIQHVNLIGYRRSGKNATDLYEVQKMPVLDFGFSKFNPPKSPAFKKLEIDKGAIPGFLNSSGFLSVDLKGEGIPGLLYNDGQSIYYYESQGMGEYSAAKAPTTFPIDQLALSETALVDLEGNGQLQLEVKNKNRNGFYKRKNDGNWGNYLSFESYPVGFGNSNFERVGLSNNGKTDLLQVEENNVSVCSSVGLAGYEACQKKVKQPDFPCIKKGCREEYVGFADVFGDGLSHRVKISNGSIECWPDLGYGNFGAKVTLGCAPVYMGDFDAARIFLADIDGSGTMDIVYVYTDKVALYINQSGNHFSDPIMVSLPESYSEIDEIGFSDILGNGTTCLIFTKAGPNPVHYYYDFVGEIMLEDKLQASMKPYLLNEINNNMGSLTQIQYCSSTKFYLEDKKAGKPWATKLHFPVQLVEKYLVIDKISGSRYTNSFKYHDGYFDPIEREFRGFGYVESWDSETYESFLENNRSSEAEFQDIGKNNYVPPIYTRTWNHTGATFENKSIVSHYKKQFFQGDEKAYDFPESLLEDKIFQSDEETLRQAQVAMNGHVIRKEVYSDDKEQQPKRYKNPYTVEESNLEVNLFQNRDDHQYAVFMVNSRESIVYHYERNPKDPRVQQTFVLEVDSYGNALQSCDVFLPRRSTAVDINHVDYAEQQALKGILSLKKYVTPLLEYLYCHVVCEEQSLELSGLDLKEKGYFSFEEIKKQVGEIGLPNRNNIVPNGGSFTIGIQARQITWDRQFFWNQEQTSALPIGRVAPIALQHHNERAVFTKAFTVDVFDNRLIDKSAYTNEGYLSNLLYKNGGYFYDSVSGYWWNKGLVQHYFLTDEPAGFYLPCLIENTFALATLKTQFKQEESLCGSEKISYDAYYLFPTEIAQQVDAQIENTVRVTYDYIVNQPKQLVDINDNISQVLFDPIGQVIVTSQFGTESGNKTGGMTLYADGDIAADYKKNDVVSFDDVICKPEQYLQGASSYFYYNLNAWTENQQPVSSIELVSNNYWHAKDQNKDAFCQTMVSYNDGLGREIAKKQKTDIDFSNTKSIDEKIKRDKNDSLIQKYGEDRWQVTGRTVNNNKGQPFEQYQPYFTNTPVYEGQRDLSGVPPVVTHYDPLGRKIRIDTPKGFFSKVEFTPWEERHFDEDDTVVDSAYYINNYPDKLTKEEKVAIDKAVVFYNTPTVKIMDNLGEEFLSIESNLGSVSKNIFTKISGVSASVSEGIHANLQSLGYLVAEEKTVKEQQFQFFWLTKKFLPYTQGFKLELDEKYSIYLDRILEILKQSCLTSYYSVDILGRNIETIDARLYYTNLSKHTDYFNFKYLYAMGAKDPVLTNSVDAGSQIHLNNIFDAQLWSWSARSYCQLITYDKLQRKLHLSVKKITKEGPVTSYDDFNLVEVFTYGESQQNAKDKNLRGQLYELKDLSGILTNHKYSLGKEILKESRQLVCNYKVAVNWRETVALEKEIYTSQYIYDAVKHLLTEITPDSSILTNSYNQVGQLKKVAVEYADKTKQLVVDKIDYDANGQRITVKFGNGVITNYNYEPTTLRLMAIKSTRPAKDNKNTTIQDIVYCYDPAGNITSTCDNTYKTVFNNNQKVEPLSEYTYDARYKLIKAKGRQHPGISANTYKNDPSEGSFKQSIYGPPVSVNEVGKLEKYTEHYTYDDSGNLTQNQHLADSASWTRKMAVECGSNRLKGLEYDASGNLRELTINSEVNLSFNCCENLMKAGIIERSDELDDCDYYMYDSEEQRTRKVSERMAHGGAVSLIEEKIYLGNYEIKRNKSVSSSGQEKNTYERQTVRVMDDHTCVMIIQYTSFDQQNPKKEKTRQCRFQMDNNLGSVSLELDKNAQIITYEEYFPYGGTAIITGTSQAEVKLKEYRYSGKERDDNTGLYYYGARYYASWLGRWLKPDPAGTVDGMNLYAFVKGNPMSHVDPSGLSKQIAIHGNKMDRPIRHAAMNTRFEKLGKKIGKDLSKLKRSKKMVDMRRKREKAFQARRIARGLGFQSNLKVRKAIYHGLRGEKKLFAHYYRTAHAGMDEHLSTASVFHLLKGIGGYRMKLSVDVMEELQYHLATISHMRSPTGMTGYSTSYGSMQHPTGIGKETFDRRGKNHGYADRVRRHKVLSVGESSSSTGIGVLSEMATTATTHTLNAFMAPSTASNVFTLSSVSVSQEVSQTEYREMNKEDVVDMGELTLDLGTQSMSSIWNPTFLDRPPSPRRK